MHSEGPVDVGLEAIEVSADILTRRYLDPVTFITAGGFEERSNSVITLLSAASRVVKEAVVFDYPNKSLNEPNRSKIISGLRQLGAAIRVVDITEEGSGISGAIDPDAKNVVVDISSMDRMVIFGVLRELEACGISCDLLYTEAETYFPDRDFYEKLTNQEASNDLAFSRYLETERSEFAYSHESRLIRLSEFFGTPEPGRPFMLISFFAFKRARLQLLMQEFEFEKKIFILGEPVREDLLWRKRCMEIVNWDLIRKTPGAVRSLPTLYPGHTDAFLESVVYKSRDFSRYNVLVAPLGSKMQSVGCYRFWSRHKEVGIVFSHPRTFFPPSYSQSYRKTFLTRHPVPARNAT